MKLVITEKPSVAITIAKVIGARTRKNGYYEGSGYIVSWCIGHLIQMSNPGAYDEKYNKWNIEDLPIIPNKYKYEVSKQTKSQFLILKKLMEDKTIDTIINACDAGREGELIFRLVYNQAKCKKRIQRLWISSMEDSAIKDGFKNLKNGKDYEKLFESAETRAIADWLVGMNMSRLYSCKYKQNYSVGRVQTPTLAMIVERDQNIENFKRELYYTLTIQSEDIELTTERIDDKEIVINLQNNLPNKLKISNVLREKKETKPDLPYDLTTLQRECNKYFGYSAKETLDIAQSLYEKKLITYPRTDSRYLTTDMITSLTNTILGKNDFDTKRIKVIFNNEKVTDHHAIIPTTNGIEKEIKEKLNDKEIKIYNLITNKLHVSFGYPLIEEKSKVEIKFKDFIFKANGKILIDEGFTKYLKEYTNKKEDVILPNLKIGDEIVILESKINEKYTQPPKRYTEDSLLKAMEIAGNEELDKNIEVERQGIGTPATRAGIIETLINREFIERNKKELISTEKGRSLIKIIDDKLKTPKTTAFWEMKLSDITNSKETKENFLNEIEKEIKDILNKNK